MWVFLRVFCFLGLPCFVMAICAIWRPVASWEGPRLPAAARAVAPILVLLTIGFPIVGIPVVVLLLWLLPRVPADRPTPIRDRVAWTAFALGISLMVTMAVFAMTQEGDGDWRPFATIRLHTRIFLGMASFALVGPLAAFLLSRGMKEESPLDSDEEGPTTLVDLVARLETLDPRMTIHAALPWTCDSPAVAIWTSDGREDSRRHGCDYFLEVFIAIELLDDWEAGLPAPPSDRERCERLIELRTPRLRRGSDRPGFRPSP